MNLEDRKKKIKNLIDQSSAEELEFLEGALKLHLQTESSLPEERMASLKASIIRDLRFVDDEDTLRFIRTILDHYFSISKKRSKVNGSAQGNI